MDDVESLRDAVVVLSETVYNQQSAINCLVRSLRTQRKALGRQTESLSKILGLLDSLSDKVLNLEIGGGKVGDQH